MSAAWEPVIVYCGSEWTPMPRPIGKMLRDKHTADLAPDEVQFVSTGERRTEFADVDQDDAGIGVHPGGDTVRFISYEDHGSILLADVELDRGDVERLRDSLTTWLEQP